jgi:hypothetical protein
MKASRARNILVVTYWDQHDPLVVNYTLPYLRIMAGILGDGSTIHLVTLDRTERNGGPWLEEDGIIHHSYPYRALGAAGFGMLLSLVWSLSRLVRKERIDVVHAWCTPAGMVGYLVSLLTGRPLVVDSYEPHAEAMVENGTWRKGGLAHRVLLLFERLQTRRAWAVVSATEGMRDYARVTYGHVPERFFVKPACVDLDRFRPDDEKRRHGRAQLGLGEKLVAVYAGKFGGIYLDREVFDLLHVAREHWGERLHVLLLTSQRPEELQPFMDRAGLPRDMFTIRSVSPREVPGFMGMADWALTPVKPVPTKRYCTPIKDGEYWSMGLPVMITPDISDDSAIIAREGIGCIIPSLDRQGYATAVAAMDALLRSGDGGALRGRIREVAERYRNFSVADAVYTALYGPGSELP